MNYRLDYPAPVAQKSSSGWQGNFTTVVNLILSKSLYAAEKNSDVFTRLRK